MSQDECQYKKGKIHQDILDHDHITLSDQRTGRENCDHKPSGLFDIIKSGINSGVQDRSFNKVIGGHERVFNTVIIQKINS